MPSSNRAARGLVNRPRRGIASRYILDTFTDYPAYTLTNGYGDPTGATGDTNLMRTSQGVFEYHIKGTQTILSPTWGATGLDIGMDQTDNDGVEVSQGITAASRAAFTARTDACFLAVTFSIADVSGTDDCAIGFRKAAAYAANIDDYTDMAALNVISGAIKIETILNNAATTTTDTTNTWADAASKTLKVIVDENGYAAYQIDGATPTAVPATAFRFDADDVLVPFMFFLHAADVAGTVLVTKWECGLL